MEFAARIGTMARRGAPLPYARELAYIESGNDQWIDTGLVTSDTMEVEFEAEILENNSFFGGRADSGNMFSLVNKTDFRWSGSGVTVGSYSHNFGTVVRFGRGKVFLNGVDQGVSFSIRTNLAWLKLYLFTRNHRASEEYPTYFCHSKLKSLKVYDDGVLLRDYIPVMSNEGHAELFDKVNLNFATRYGEFTWGELDASSAPVSSRGGGTKCLTPRRSYRRLARPSSRFCAHSQEWEVAA